MDALENYYSGDSAWMEFSEMFDEFRDDPNVIELAKLFGDQIDLAVVIFGKVGPGYKNWINSKIPALENISPTECVSDATLMKRLREMLMRMPC